MIKKGSAMPTAKSTVALKPASVITSKPLVPGVSGLSAPPIVKKAAPVPVPSPLRAAAPAAAPIVPKTPTSGVRPAVAYAPRERDAITTPKKRSRKTLVIAIIVAVLIVSVTASITIGKGTAMSANVPSSGPRRVAAPGLVEAESGLLNLSFELSGRLVNVCVEEGQSVQAGQVIAELQNGDANARVDEARAAVGVAEAQLKTMEVELNSELIRCEHTVDRCAAELALLKAGPRPEEIARAKAEVTALEADSKRAAEDAAKYTDKAALEAGAWTVQQRDNARRLAESAAARLNAARETLGALQSGSRKEDIDRAQAIFAAAQADLQRATSTQESRLNVTRAQISEANARLKMTQAELSKTILRAPIAGKVVWKHHHTGESVGVLPPDPIVAIADCSRLRVRASVDEADFVNIKPGQKVQITSDACPGKSFKGTVVMLSNSAGPKKFNTGEAKEKMDINVVETLIKIDEPTPLKLGVRVTAIFDMSSAGK
jgi:HlyD family secretion protein